MTKINNDIANRVEYILIKWPLTRDSDMVLVAQFWALESKFNEKNTAFEVFELIKDGKLTNFESIRRVRCKLQECYPELRGLKYQERHKRQSSVVSNLNALGNHK
jgi:hypothetical protein